MRNKDKKRINRAIEDFKITLKNKENYLINMQKCRFGKKRKKTILGIKVS